MYSLNIQDEEIRSKYSGALNESQAQSPVAQVIEQDIRDKTGIKVNVKIDESTQTIVVKRLLIG
jgi:hypothetical protein